MLYRFRRLNLQDGSPGGGAPPAAAPAAPQANGAGTAPSAPATIDVQALTSQIRDGLFADLRRAGVFKGKNDPGEPPAPAASSSPTTGLTADDVSKMIARRDSFHQAVGGVTLTEGARQRMLRAFEAEKPDDVSTWAKGYLTDFGLDKSTGAATASTTTVNQPQPTGPPITNTGAPAAPAMTPTDDVPLWKLSVSDREHLLKTKGAAGFRQRYVDSMRGTRVALK